MASLVLVASAGRGGKISSKDADNQRTITENFLAREDRLSERLTTDNLSQYQTVSYIANQVDSQDGPSQSAY